ncbi:MAG: MFS transporter [Gammaproteobacteria bacterium]|nr:MFS transporter [Gammaproteobacteria bacterium]
MTPRIWFLVACGIAIVLTAGGLRLSFGVLLKPISSDLEIGRQVFGLVLAVQALIFGLVQPFVGLLADRFGSLRVISVSAVLFALGMFFAGQAETALGFGLSLGVLVGFALSGCTQVVVLGAVGRAVPPARQGTAFGMVISAQSLGMFLVVPGVQELVDNFAWRPTMTILAVGVLVLPLFALGMRARVAPAPSGPQQSVTEALVEARSQTSYWLLTAGFFVCGFHVTFIAVHLPAYFVDQNISAQTGALALAVIGLFNMVGAYVFGALGDRFKKKNLLVFIYLGRAVVMGSLLFIPVTDFVALLFGAIMGVFWLGTVPLTSGIVAQMFGTRYFGMLFGVVFLGHQLGSFAGAWLGGYVYDVTGSYDWMWIMSAALGVLAAILNWPIVEKPLSRLAAPVLAALGISPTPIRLRPGDTAELRAVGMDATGQPLTSAVEYEWDSSDPALEVDASGGSAIVAVKPSADSEMTLTVRARVGDQLVFAKRIVTVV